MSTTLVGRTSSTFKREDLNAALKTIGTVLPKKSVIQAYEHILVEPDEDGTALTATDGEVWVRHRLEVPPIDEPFMILGTPFVQTISKLKDNEIELVLKEDDEFLDVTIKAGKYGRYSIPAMDSEDFVRIDKGDYRHIASLDAGALRDPIKMSLACLSDDASKLALCYVLFESPEGDEKPRIVATDTKKLAIFNPRGEITESIKLPKLAVETIISADGGEIEIYTDDRTAKLRCGDVSVYCTLINNDTYPYPNYRAAMGFFEKETPVGTFSSNTKDILSVVGRLGTYQDKEMPHLWIDFEGEAPIISTKSLSKSSKGQDEFPCEYDGDPTRIGVNPGYLSSLLQAVPADNITFTIANENGMLWRTDDGAHGMVMLMNPPI